MEYNKNTYAKSNEKKVLHKIRKHWVVVSTALLMALGGGAVATTHASAHADANSNNGDADTSSTQTAQSQPKATLTNQSGQPAQQGNQADQAVSTTGRQATSGNTNGLNPNVEKQAAALHASLLGSSDHAGNGQSVSNQSVFSSKPKALLGSINFNGGGQAGQASTYVTSDPDHLDPKNQGFTYNTSNVANPDGSNGRARNVLTQKWTSDDAYNPSDGSTSDFGQIYVQYVDPSDGDYPVGSLVLAGKGISSDDPGVDPDNFTHAQLDHYLESVPPLKGKYGTGYSLVDDRPDHLESDANIDSGKGIVSDTPHFNSYLGGQKEFIVINVKNNQPVKSASQIDVQTVNEYTGKVMGNSVQTDSDGASFGQDGFTDLAPNGWTADYWKTGVLNTATGQIQLNDKNTDPITKFNDKDQILAVYVKPLSGQVSDTVHYVDESDGNEVSSPVTVHGVNSDSIDFTALQKYAPSGYSDDTTYSGSMNGLQYGAGHAGISKYTTDGNIYLAVKKSSSNTPTPEPVSDGQITVVYKDESGKVIEEEPTVEPVNSSFNIGTYTGNVPDGYQFDSNYNQNNYNAGVYNPEDVSTYPATGNNEEVDIAVNKNPNRAIPPMVTNDKIQYMSVDPANPSAAPQPILDSATKNYTFNIYGKPGDTIQYGQYTNNPPQGYVTVGLGSHSNTYESNQTNVILVENTTKSNVAAKMGEVDVEYIDSDNGKTIDNVYYQGQAGTSFNNKYWSQAQSFLPSGWATGNSMPNINGSYNFKAGVTQLAYVYVTKSGAAAPLKNTMAYIQYDVIDPNAVDPATGYYKVVNSDIKTSDVRGDSGTPINYTNVINNVPSGYTFYSFGTPLYATIQKGKVSHIDVIPANSMPSTIKINYIDQSGHNVDDQSPADTWDIGADGQPQDDLPLTGNYGQTFDMTQIQDDRPVPSNYKLAPGQQNTLLAISNHPQTVDIRVIGKSKGTTDTTNAAYTLNVHRNIKDANGDQLFSDTIPVAINGVNYGDVVTIDPNTYMPNPADHYSDDSTPYKVYVGSHGIAQDDTNADPIPNNTINFNYKENVADGNIEYVNVDNHNQVVGTKVVSDVPNTDMATVYQKNDVTSLIPANYQLDSDYTDSTWGNGIDNNNNPKLVNNTNYIVYVKSSHTQSGTVTPVANMGTVHVVYQMKDANDSNYHTVATELASGKVGSDFSDTPYMKATPNGLMPDAYSDATVAQGTTAPTKYTSSDQTLTLDVQAATSSTNPNLGQTVSDQINYDFVNSDNVDTGKIASVKISGKDGSAIDYVPYTENVPKNDYYDGMKSYLPDYTQGMNNDAHPIATIYVKKTVPASHNNPSGYDPTNTSDVKDHNGHPVPGTSNKTFTPGVTPATATGNYYPWPGGNSDGTGTAPLDGPENSDDPISQAGYSYDPSDAQMPNNYQNDNKGMLPKGYLPAWVPDKKADANDASKYQSGYVPSDYIPSDYEPGYVPNGKGQYVPGYVPVNPALQPKGVKYIPEDVDGHSGMGPDESPYASNTSSVLTIQYVTGANNSDVVQSFDVQGTVGSSLDLTGGTNANGTHYLTDVPTNYQLNKSAQYPNGVLGEYDGTSHNDVETNNRTDGITNINGTNLFGFSDTPHTIQIAVNQDANATIAYIDNDPTDKKSYGMQVGTAHVSGVAGQNLNFNKDQSDYKFLQLLPYGYHIKSVTDAVSDSTPILSNGSTYRVNVYPSHDQAAPSPEGNVKAGHVQITYLYTAGGKSYDVGNVYLDGNANSDISSSDAEKLVDPATNHGDIPYGYDLAGDHDNEKLNLTGDQYKTGTPNPVTIAVKLDTNQQKNVTPGSDIVEYRVLDPKTGKSYALTTKSDANGMLLPSDNPAASSAPALTFNVKGDDGSTINYDPYTNNVPNGYFYFGMGNHSSVIDGAHDSVTSPEVIYLKPSTVEKSTNNGMNGVVTVNYVNDSVTGDPKVGSLQVKGYTGNTFDAGYYMDNVPAGYQFDQSVDNRVANFPSASAPETMTVHVTPAKSNVKEFGTITVKYVSSVSNDEVAPEQVSHGYVGNIVGNAVSLEQPPKGYIFDHIEGSEAYGYDSSNQTMKVVVDPID